MLNMTQTFLKSCEHWSEHYLEEMHNFYKLAGLDYLELANSVNWAAVLLKIRQKVNVDALEILDVACGSGMFPTVLQQVLLEKDKKLFINYSLLDPSKFAINETKKKLRHPFHLSKEFNVTLQDFNCIGDLFHISWAIHALYAIPKNELKISLEKFYGSFKEKGFIAHACNDSHYINFHNLYNRGFRDGKFQAFCSAEDILDTLDSLDFKYKVHFIEYANTAKSDDLVIVEAYLQRCLFDDTISLSEMRKNNLTGKYLDSCNGSGGWRFPQKVALIELNKSFD
tara:strand:- start:1865 stop:2713 length:849 start_codon:yes stop_codon:yes gene_type:complete